MVKLGKYIIINDRVTSYVLDISLDKRPTLQITEIIGPSVTTALIVSGASG